MGADRADEYGGRNAVEGELLVRVTPQKIVAYKNISIDGFWKVFPSRTPSAFQQVSTPASQACQQPAFACARMPWLTSEDLEGRSVLKC